MPVTRARSRWVNGALVFETQDGATELGKFDGALGLFLVPNMVRQVRGRFTAAQVNAGAELLPAVAGYKYRMVDMALIAIGGAATAATSVDILGTRTTAVKLLAGLVAGLTEDTLLRAGAATNGVILAAGASFTTVDANTAITIGKTGSSLATATHIDALVTYVLEEA